MEDIDELANGDSRRRILFSFVCVCACVRAVRADRPFHFEGAMLLRLTG